jgi:hypothetical protein
MSKLLDNKQIIHIVSEIFVISGITIYFSSQNKKLLNHINDLTQRIDDQEELIQTHEKKIAQLVSIVENLSNNIKESRSVESRPFESRPVESRPVESRPVESRPVDSRPVDSRPVDSRPVESRPVENKNSKVKNIPKKTSSINIRPVENFDNLESINLNKPTISFSTIVMEKSIPAFTSDSKVEEIIDESDENSEESTDESLDAELEEELKDLN